MIVLIESIASHFTNGFLYSTLHLPDVVLYLHIIIPLWYVNLLPDNFLIGVLWYLDFFFFHFKISHIVGENLVLFCGSLSFWYNGRKGQFVNARLSSTTVSWGHVKHSRQNAICICRTVLWLCVHIGYSTCSHMLKSSQLLKCKWVPLVNPKSRIISYLCMIHEERK